MATFGKSFDMDSILALNESMGSYAHTKEVDNILFYSVGENASHVFYLGFKDNELYRMSCSEYDEPCIRKVESGNSVYLGR